MKTPISPGASTTHPTCDFLSAEERNYYAAWVSAN
jgi:hypothetical protein